MSTNIKPTEPSSEATRSFTIIDGLLHQFVAGVWSFTDAYYKSSGQSLWVDGFQLSGSCDEEGVWDLYFSTKPQYDSEPAEFDENPDSYDGYYRDSEDCVCSASHFDVQ